MDMENPPKADWLRRFASHALELSPLTFPLDAMRRAMFAHSEMGELDPEEAAERWWADSQNGTVDVESAYMRAGRSDRHQPSH